MTIGEDVNRACYLAMKEERDAAFAKLEVANQCLLQAQNAAIDLSNKLGKIESLLKSLLSEEGMREKVLSYNVGVQLIDELGL